MRAAIFAFRAAISLFALIDAAIENRHRAEAQFSSVSRDAVPHCRRYAAAMPLFASLDISYLQFSLHDVVASFHAFAEPPLRHFDMIADAFAMMPPPAAIRH